MQLFSLLRKPATCANGVCTRLSCRARTQCPCVNGPAQGDTRHSEILTCLKALRRLCYAPVRVTR